MTEAFVREVDLQRTALGAGVIEPVVISHPLSTLSDTLIEQRAAHALTQVERVLVG